MSQDTINQRLKALIEALGLNVRSFSAKLGVSDSTTRNYIDKGSKPPAEYIATVASSIERVNPAWLLLGQGEMFLDAPEAVRVVSTGPANSTSTDVQDSLRKEIDLLWTLIASRDALIEAKDVIIAAKDETLSLLREVRNRPN